MSAGLAAVLAGAAQFQLSWFLTIISLGMLAFVCWGVYQVVRTFGAMLRAGDTLLFATCLALVTVSVLFFGSMIAMVLISLGPPIGNGS